MLWIISFAALAALWCLTVRRVRELRAAYVLQGQRLQDAERAARATADVLRDEYEAHRQDSERAQKEIESMRAAAISEEETRRAGGTKMARELANILSYNGTESGQVDVDG